jgi:hypothetical protein
VRLINSDQKLFDILNSDEFIVLDQLIPEWYIYGYDSNGVLYQKETIDIDYSQFESLENWTKNGVVERKLFISPQTSLAYSYSKWLVSYDYH